MNLIDKITAAVAPRFTLARVRARHALQVMNEYEAAKPSRTRKNPGDNRAADVVTGVAGTLRGQARHLEHNHDLANGILSVLVKRTVGPKGITVEPMPKDTDGKILYGLAKQISKLRERWEKSPEVTGELSNAMSEQLLARTWFRDGEALAKDVMGTAAGLRHGSKVPFSVELLEPDFLPLELNDMAKGIRQGIQRNGWGRPTYYHLYKSHPGDWQGYNIETRPVNADVIHHIKLITRLGQGRGVSVFSSVMNRLNDIKDYEESERVAARIAAAMAFYIRKGNPELYNAEENDGEDGYRDFDISPGMMFDDLAPGEDIGTIQSNRPSPLLQSFRDAMLKACSSGTGAAYSSISKNYDGSYSARRQENVDSWDDYRILTSWFIHLYTRPVYERFVQMALASGQLDVPENLDHDTLFDADFGGPVMPQVDPNKEANSEKTRKAEMLTSPQKLIRAKGDNPHDVLDQWEQWNEELRSRGLEWMMKNQPPESEPLPDTEDEKDEE